MIKLKNNNGITLLILLITIVVFGIILGVTIELSTDSIRSSIKTQETAELLIVQHAMFEKKREVNEKNDVNLYVGTLVKRNYDPQNYKDEIDVIPSDEYKNADSSELDQLQTSLYKYISIDELDPDKYYFFLSRKEEFEKLGLSGETITESKYLINYETGYVKKMDSKATPLQGYYNDSVGNTTSYMIEP